MRSGAATGVPAPFDETLADLTTRHARTASTPATTNAVLIDLETHMAEHLGQAIAYARMNGIVPPWSK